MSGYLYLTHTNDLNFKAQELLQRHDIICKHVPFVRKKPRVLERPRYTDYAIVTSFTAIDHLQPWLSLFSTIYCIGAQSADYAEQLGVESNKVLHGSLEAPSLKALMEKYQECFHSELGTWYGSSAGVLKHQTLFQRYPNVHVQITHWNWPDYEQARNLSQRLISGTLICSSISAALAISSTSWHEDVQIIVSSKRLMKFISVTLHKKTRISFSWISEIIGNRL